MDLVARTTVLRTAVQQMPAAPAPTIATWARQAKELADASKKLDLTNPDLLAENAGLATRLGDLAKDLSSLAYARKSRADLAKEAEARVLNTSEQVEVLTREPAARCSGDPRKLLATPGRIDPAKIQTVVRERFEDLQKCYEDGLKRDPKLAGKVSIRFVIDRDGKVSSAENAASLPIPPDAIAPPSSSATPSIADPKLVDCVLAITRRLQFPKPEGGTVTVVYPFVFGRGP